MSSLSTALTTIRRTPYQSLGLMITVTITLLVAYAVSFLVLGTDILLKDLETKPQIIAFFELNTPVETIEKLKQELEQSSAVKSVVYISQEEALKLYQAENQADPLLLELVTANILPASIEVQASTLTDLEQIKALLTDRESVEEVAFPDEFIQDLQNWMLALRTAGLVAVSIMGVQFFLTIFIAIGLKTASQKSAISISRLLGASKGYIKRPILIEGALYGLVASILGWLITLTAFLAISPELQPFGVPTLALTQPTLLAAQLAIGTVLAMLLGMLAGYVASSKLLHGN